MSRKIVYVDIDNTIADFTSAYMDYKSKFPEQPYPQSQVGFFLNLKLIDNLVPRFLYLIEKLGYEVWILTRPSVRNPLCYTEKRLWLEKHFGYEICERLILCTDKSLLRGDLLIDDNEWKDFQGEQILYGSDGFDNWAKIYEYLRDKNKTK